MDKWRFSPIFHGICALALGSFLFVILKNNKSVKLINNIKQKSTPSFSLCDELLRKPQNIKWIYKLLEDDKNSKIKDSRGRYPLHSALSIPFPDFTIVETLIKQFPDALQICDVLFGATPLHYCVHHDTQDPDIVELVVHSYPEALLTTDAAEFLPIHRCVHRDHPDIETLHILVINSPSSLMIPTTNGNLPLHWLCVHCPPNEEAIMLVYTAYPDAWYIKNEKNMSPSDILIENMTVKMCKVSRNIYDMITHEI